MSKLFSVSHLLLMPCNLGSKSSAKSSHSSLQTLALTLSFASTFKSNAKALQCGVKHSITNGSKVITQPLKHAKCVATNATSTPIESQQEVEQETMNDNMTISSNGTEGACHHSYIPVLAEAPPITIPLPIPSHLRMTHRRSKTQLVIWIIQLHTDHNLKCT